MSWYVSIGLYLWELVKTWVHTIFVTPYTTMDMLWILVPVWLAWFFAEFFQEKTGTSMGNAITNATVVVWAAIDCTRQTFRLMNAGELTGFLNISLRFLLLLIIFAYGLVIIILGWRGNKVIKYLGRVREVTYVFAIFVPVFYNAIPFSFKHILAALLFFPLFYFTIELIDRVTPNPRAVDEDNNRGGASGNDDFSLDKPAEPGKDDFSNMGDFGKAPAAGKDDFKF
ncbi:hypothetical protein JXA85_08930 [Candidatus Woesearchaeota archaeon]|nr:hypothetical protein [Candidatus Woesearchaeota archaeon]